MRPIPISDEDYRKIVNREGAVQHRRVVMTAASGDMLDDDVRPAEAVIYAGSLGLTYGFVIQLDNAEIFKLNNNGGKLLFTCIGGVAPFDHEVLE